jgi:hypothetical protein
VIARASSRSPGTSPPALPARPARSAAAPPDVAMTDDRGADSQTDVDVQQKRQRRTMIILAEAEQRSEKPGQSETRGRRARREAGSRREVLRLLRAWSRGRGFAVSG